MQHAILHNIHVLFLCKDLWQPAHRCLFPNFAVQVCLIKEHLRTVSLSATHMMNKLYTWNYGHWGLGAGIEHHHTTRVRLS